MFCEDYRQRSVSLAEGGRWPTFDSREILKKKNWGGGVGSRDHDHGLLVGYIQTAHSFAFLTRMSR